MKEYASSTVSYTTQMTYDATGNLLTVVDAKTTARATTAMTYDTLGRQTAITYLLGTTVVASESATYDLAGRPLTKVDRSGVQTTTEYDAAGRVWAVRNPSETVCYFRDAMGRVVTLDGAYDVTYTYNFRGWITGMQKWMGLTKTVTIGYNAAGVMNSITYPNTAQVTYAFDTCGRPNNVKLNGTTVWSGVYYPDDRLNTETLADSNVVTYTYDTRDRLDLATSTRLSLDYHYDAVGNVDGLVSSSGGTESYAYDYLGRMTSANGAWGSISYTYDEVGNRKTKVEGGVTTTYSYDTNGMNTVIHDSTPWDFSYDSNGQMTLRSGSSAKYNYDWDSLGRLDQVDKATLKAGKWTTATVASYYYSADGSRLYAFDGPGFTTGVTYKTYYYVGQELWVEMSSVSGDISASSYRYYIYVGGDLKAVWAADEGKVYCYYNDALGSTWQVWTAGARKAAFSVISYKPFGIPYTQTGTETVKFAGEMLDTSTAPSGLYYLRARYMDPELGRFISMDPILGSLSTPQTQDRYTYCINNPLRFVDPSGRWLESAFDIGCIAWDIKELWDNPSWENAGWLLLDIGCLIAPGVPALSPVLKTVKWADKANDARKTADRLDAVADSARQLDSFVPGTRTSIELTQDTYLYRSFDSIEKMKGRWFALTPSPNPEVAKALYALPPDNSAKWLVRAWIPKGTTVEISVAKKMPWGESVGGGLQVFVRDINLPLYDIPRML